jgi:simple sugar transport system ATP-binding protein
MTDVEVREVVEPSKADVPMLEIRNMTKMFGSVISLSDISTTVRAGQVTCVLGDNGAGKSTLIKILSGVYQPDGGQLLVDGRPARFGTPRDALDAGIATVFQDLAVVPLMAVWRNFFLGSEPTKGWGPFKRFDAWASTSATPTSRSARSRVASASQWRSRGPCISVHGC